MAREPQLGIYPLLAGFIGGNYGSIPELVQILVVRYLGLTTKTRRAQ
jgi:hypothetical protein